MWQPCRQGRVKRSSAHFWALPFYWYTHYTENDDGRQMFFAKTETSEVSETSEVCNQYPLFARRAKCVLAEAETGNSRFIRAARWRPARRVGATFELARL